jgi:CDP-diacylglycerol---glycerol-3-phosphate 3-phosphatidyltransferase
VSGSLVSPETRARVRGRMEPITVRALGVSPMEPIALVFGRIGLTPNALTVIGFLIACAAAAAAGAQAWLVAGLLVVVGAVFDLFDGALARATGKASKLGAFMDSTFDRGGEGVVYVGIVWGALDMGLWHPVILAAAAMAAAFMVSYTRAKAESLGFTTGSGMANVGLAPREVRIVILTIGLMGAGVVGTGIQSTCDTCAGGTAYPPGALVLDAALGLIAVLATVTTIQRIVHTIRQAAQQG